MLILPKIKICGLKTVEQIAMINKYAVDYIGLVFAKSKRQISPDNARKMRASLRSDIKAIGVFVDTPTEEINEIVKYCSLDIVQLHGCESNEECLRSIVPVWKAILLKMKKVLEHLNYIKV